ncbi:cysteine-rich receptor-like protein kinase 2 [Macadamia integrifolia]|uniref:cysteine-rich receptor-like protein kinase 2 n=1 Tax=Macadamia integrifolia TaxID=60698 RepID=UPI001C4EB7F4|nr:cysteine-rich receptor-like protein kinase 2 [Macadamia integrifolia]XP_042497892.1 cysteine-rich receptor-like protein kinase 2 [Macadamia integrifolia]
MKKSDSPLFLVLVLLVYLLVETTLADPRSHTVELRCSTRLEHNTTIYVPNFIGTMDVLGNKLRTSDFAVAIVGSGVDGNYGLAQCYGDLSSLDCVLCYAEARTILPKCFPYNGGRIYLDGCFLRAENYSFFQEITSPGDKAVCGNATRKGPEFLQSAKKAVLDAVAAAPYQGGYSSSVVQVSGTTNESAYVLANCWRTLDPNSCRQCLENASASMIGCFPWSEGRALFAGCFMRYSDTNFLNAEQSSGNSTGSIAVMIIAILSSVAVLILGAAIGVYIWKHIRIQKKRRGANDMEKLVKTLNDSSLNFKYSTLERATGSFDDDNKLGQGGFGTVYKGVLPDGREIAVKRLFFNNRHRAADFYNEVNMISTLEHKNLVRLLGCSCSGPESLLVYEFLPNKSLDRFLFDPSRGKALTWGKRFKIIKGTAQGLVYLHENPNIRVIHRDIKASNILLDSKLQAKIADFGLARSFQEDKSHISTAIAGTLGYMAPEYLAHGQLTEKADVYSFGVLLLEIITGMQNNRSITAEYSDSLVAAAWRHFQLGTAEKLFDPNLLLHNYSDDIKKEILRVVHVGLLCAQEVPSLRPSMSKTLQMLLKNDEQLPPPTNPPFIDVTTMALSDSCADQCHLIATTSLSAATISHSSFYPR